MVNSMRVTSPAKLNLHLKILGKRSDGFHSLESVFQTIPLYDDIEVKISDHKGKCEVASSGVQLPFENTIAKAYKEFCAFANLDAGISVSLNKNIPLGAGLGGGSSNAASVLLLLNEMFGKHFSLLELEKLAKKIGSDVPFFLYGGCAIVSGRGEIVKRISCRTDLSFVLVYPNVHCDTASSYKLLDECGYDDDLNTPKLDDLESIYNSKVCDWSFVNTFTLPLAKKHFEIQKALQNLNDVGAEFVNMTGSGSAVFGVFSSIEKCKKAYTELCNYWNKCYCLLSSDSR